MTESSKKSHFFQDDLWCHGATKSILLIGANNNNNKKIKIIYQDLNGAITLI